MTNLIIVIYRNLLEMIQSDTTSLASNDHDSSTSKPIRTYGSSSSRYRYSRPSTPVTTPIVEPRTSTPVVEPRASTPVVEPRASTPVVEPRASTPVVEPRASTSLIIPIVESRAATPEEVVRIDVEKRSETRRHEGGDVKLGKKLDKIEETLKRQSKRLQALYEIQKSTNAQIKWIQNHLKQQINNNNNVDLTSKVFMVSNFNFWIHIIFK